MLIVRKSEVKVIFKLQHILIVVVLSLLSTCSCSPLLPGLDWVPSLLQIVPPISVPVGVDDFSTLPAVAGI